MNKSTTAAIIVLFGVLWSLAHAQTEYCRDSLLVLRGDLAKFAKDQGLDLKPGESKKLDSVEQLIADHTRLMQRWTEVTLMGCFGEVPKAPAVSAPRR